MILTTFRDRVLKDNKIKVAPSLLAANFAKLESEIRRIEEGGADLLHLDIMDGHFVPNISYGIPVVEAVRRVTKLKLDTHLMLNNPGEFIEPFCNAGADSLTFHLEATTDPVDLINRIKKFKLECGLAINPRTPIEKVLPFISDLNLVLIMSVEPGFGGQPFLPEVLPKASSLSAWIQKKNIDLTIEMDGGISPENAKECRQAGVNLLVAGSSVFGSNDVAAAIAAIRGQS